MRYISLFSGIEAATAAWHGLGWEPVAFSEIEPFPSAVLAHHYPDVPNLGDVTKYQEWPDLGPVDLVCGGSPCQSFSVAGLRAGMADPRGNLALTYLGVVDRYQPRWVVYENVPGLLSSNGGRDFGSFLGGLVELGYGFSYRVLDAQYCRASSLPFAVPQRRRRVFVVGYLGDWRRAAAVLFDAASLRGDSPPRREAGKNVAPTIAARTRGGGGLGTDFELDGGLIAADVASTLNAHFGDKQGLEDQHVNQGMPLFVAHALRAEGFDASEDGTGRGTPIIPEIAQTLTRGAESAGKGGYARRRQEDDANVIAFDTTQITSAAIRSAPKPGDPSHLLAAGAHPPAIAIQAGAVRENPESGPDGVGVRQDGASYTIEARSEVQAVAFDMRGRENGAQFEGPHDTANIRAASGGSSRSYVAQQWAVRRLTPVECARLQGFTDDYLTSVRYRGAAPADGPMYKALGNSMARNVMEIIGERIAMVDAIE